MRSKIGHLFAPLTIGSIGDHWGGEGGGGGAQRSFHAVDFQQEARMTFTSSCITHHSCGGEDEDQPILIYSCETHSLLLPPQMQIQTWWGLAPLSPPDLIWSAVAVKASRWWLRHELCNNPRGLFIRRGSTGTFRPIKKLCSFSYQIDQKTAHPLQRLECNDLSPHATHSQMRTIIKSVPLELEKVIAVYTQHP